MAEREGTSVLAGSIGNGLSDQLSHSTQPGHASGNTLSAKGKGAAFRNGPLGHYHDAEVATLGFASSDFLAHPRDIVRDFWNQDYVRATGEPGMQSNPAGITPHDLDDHDSIVTLGCRVKPVDSFGGSAHGGVESERDRGTFNVIVDGFRYSDNRQTALPKFESDREGSVAADQNQGANRVSSYRGQQLVGPVNLDDRPICLPHRPAEWVAAVGGSEDSPADVRNAPDGFTGKGHDVAFTQQPPKSPLDPEDFPPAMSRTKYHGADDRVEAGRVAATSRNRDPSGRI